MKWNVATIVTVIIFGIGAAIGFGELRQKVNNDKEYSVETRAMHQYDMTNYRSDLKELNKAVSDLTTEVKVLTSEMKRRRTGHGNN